MTRLINRFFPFADREQHGRAAGLRRRSRVIRADREYLIGPFVD